MTVVLNYNQNLIIAIITWWGLEDVGTWEFDEEPSTKTVTYNTSKEVAKNCFLSNTDSCPKPCKKTKTGCIPNKYKNMWSPTIKHNEPPRINSKADGECFQLLQSIKLESNTYCFMLEKSDLSKDILIVIFPVGEIDLRDTIVNSVSKVLLKAIAEYKMIVFAGHSMGCAYAQKVAYNIYKDNQDICQKLFIVGSGGFIWANNDEIKNFKKFYTDRYKFFGAGEDSLKDYVLESYPGRLNKIVNDLKSIDITLITLIDNQYKYEQYTPAKPNFERPTLKQARIHKWLFYRKCIFAWIQSESIKNGGKKYKTT